MKRNQSACVFGIILMVAGFGFVLAGIMNSQSNTAYYWAFNVLGAVLVLAGITPVVRYVQARREGMDEVTGSRRWRPDQEWIDAEIVGVTRNLRTAGDQNVEYYVICRYLDAATHQEETFTSRALKEYPGKEIIGKMVRVHFHSKDPDDYTVELDTIR